MFDVCCYSNDNTPLPTTYFKLAPKTIKGIKYKTTKIRNDFEQWCDVQGAEQSGGSDKETKTIVSHYNIQKNNDIVKDNFNFISLIIFSPDNWYCNSVEFNTISQYYKGNHDTLHNNNGILGMSTRVKQFHNYKRRINPTICKLYKTIRI